MIRYKRYYEKKIEDVENKIIEFFMKNSSPSDEQVHKLSNNLKIDTHEFEAVIYSILGALLGEGKSKDFFGTFDEDELKKGIEIEMEHTTNFKIAEKIAKDHLSEFSNYYTALEKMEKELEME